MISTTTLIGRRLLRCLFQERRPTARRTTRPVGKPLETLEDRVNPVSLSFTPSDAANFLVIRSGSQLDVYNTDAFDGGTGKTLISSTPFATVTDVTFTGTAGIDNQVVVDLSGGDAIPDGGVAVNFDSGDGDRVAVVGNGTQTADYTPDATTTGNGTVSTSDGTITFTGMTGTLAAGLDLSGLAAATVTLPSDSNAIDLTSDMGYATFPGTGVVVIASAVRFTGSTGGVPFTGASVSATSTASLVLPAGSNPDVVQFVGADFTTAGVATFDLDTGTGATDTTSQPGSLTVGGLRLAGEGTFTLDHFTNDIDTVAADVVGDLVLGDADELTVGTVGATTGLSATGSVTVSANGDLIASGASLTATSGSVFVSALGNATFDAVTAGAGVTVFAAGDTLLGGPVTAGGDVLVSSAGTFTTGATGTVTSTGGGVDLGSGGDLSVGAAVSASGMLSLSTGGNLTTDAAGSLTSTAGFVLTTSLGPAVFGAPVSGDGSVSLLASGGLTTNATVTSTAADVFTYANADTVFNAAVSAATAVTITTDLAGNLVVNAAVTGGSVTATVADDLTVTATGSATASGPITTTNAGDLTVNGPVTSTGAATSLTANDPAGSIITLNAAVTGFPATVAGGPGADMFFINTLGSGSDLTADGAGAADEYFIPFGAYSTTTILFLNDTGGTPGDIATIDGTAVADTFNVNSAMFVGFVESAGQRVKYNGAGAGGLEDVIVNGFDGDDVFNVHPDPTTQLTLHGGPPTTPPGDTLNLNVLGVLNPILSIPSRPNGMLTSDDHATVFWDSIETLPIPVGLGGQFDFQPTAANLQMGWTLVTPATLYTMAQGYGWTKAPPRGYSGGALPTSPLPAQNISNLLRDGVDGFTGLANAAIFRIDLAGSNPTQLTAYLGDAFSQRDGIQLDYSLDGVTYTPMTPVGGLAYPSGQFNSFSAVVNPTTLMGGVYPVFVRIWDAGGVIPNWAIAGLEVRPVALVAPLTIARADAAPGTTQQASDGLSVDTYTGSGADPGAFITVDTGTQTPVTPDARPDMLGFQVIADMTGAFTFDLRRPTGTPTSTITARDFLGASSTDPVVLGVPFTQEFQLPQVRRIDFGPAAAPVSADEGGKYLGLGTGLYTAANQLGWVTAPSGTFDRGGPSNPVRDLLRDGVFATGGTGTRDFRIDLPVGGAAQYAVTVVMGDLLVARDQMQVQVVTGTLVGGPIPLIATPTGQVLPVTFIASPDGSGVLTLRFSDLGGDPAWSLQSIEIRPLPAATLPAPPLSPPPATLPPPPFQVQRLLTISSGAPAEIADGTTASSYTVTGATPGSLVTLASPWGTFQGTDASTLYVGFQVLADSTGMVTFSLVFPRSAGTLTGTITASEVTGAGASSTASGAFTTTAGAAFYRFDMNAVSNNTAAGWIGVRSNTLYSSAANSGYGWTANVNEFERSGVTLAPTAMYQDGNFGRSVPGVFQLAVGTATVDVRVIVYDTLSNLRLMTITVEGAGIQMVQPVSNPNGVYEFFGAVDTNADGVVTVTLNSGGHVWVVNGIEVAQPGQLPSLPQLAGFARPANTERVPTLTADQLAPIVAEAIARLSNGATPEQIAALRAVRFTIADLDAVGRLGQHSAGVVTLDDDGYGTGWFIDPTPADDVEFTGIDAPTQLRAVSGSAAGRVDLLTVVMHELSHEWGLVDRDAAAVPFDLMSETLGLGIRRLPASISVTVAPIPVTTPVVPSPAVDANAPMIASADVPLAPATISLWLDTEDSVAVPRSAVIEPLSPVATPPAIDASATAGPPVAAIKPTAAGLILFAPETTDDEFILNGVSVG